MIAIGSLRLLRLSALVSAVFVAWPVLAQGPTVTHPVITPPTAIQRVEAHYPESALATGDHVDVLLELTIDADGHVTKAIVLTSGGTEFDNAAMAAAKSWLFAPAKRNGKPAESRIHVPFHFAPPEIVSATHDTHAGGEPDVAKKDSSQGEVAQTTTPPTIPIKSKTSWRGN